jgi:hypothetical protein
MGRSFAFVAQNQGERGTIVLRLAILPGGKVMYHWGMPAEVQSEARETAVPAAAQAASGMHIISARTLRYAALAVIVVVFALGTWSWVQFGRASGLGFGLYTQSDFPAVTIASRMVSQGRGADLYSLPAQLEGQRQLIAEGYVALSPSDDLKYPYPYAPFTAVLLSPLSGLTPTVAWAVWDILNIGGMAGGLWFLLSALSLSKWTTLLLLLGGLTSIPFIVNLEQGQSSGVVMLGLALGIGFLKRGRALPAGLAFGLLLLKVQWLPFLVLVLLWKRQWRALAGIAATGAVLMLLTVVQIGMAWIPGYIDMLLRSQRYDRALLLDPAYSHSLAGGLTALLGGGTDELVRSISLGVMLVLTGFLLWVWRRPWQPNTREWDGMMALTLLAAILTNLQLNTHDLVLLVLPGALGLSYLLTARHAGLTVGWCVVLWVGYVAMLFMPMIFALPLRLTTLLILAMTLVMATPFVVRFKSGSIPIPT